VREPTAITIGELSRRTGCKVETVRYYERVGLMPPAPRTAGRYRLYHDGDVRRLAFVRRARELGFTLDDVRTLLTLAREQADGPCAEARALAAAHLAAVRSKIADLRAMERVLDDAVDRCATGAAPNCPVIDALAGGAKAPRSRRAGAARRRRG
jgi:MerR family transcriptional regulator, mercuric resistance operon regulatory protein